MEGQEALQALATRFPRVTLEHEDLAYVPTLNTRALQRLPVVLD
jgi:cytochrome P450